MTLFGLIWSPFGALICGLVALQKKMQFTSHATAGAKCSSSMLLPWFYLLIRLTFNKSLPMLVVMSVYVLIYTTWLYYVVLSVGGLVVFVIALLIVHSNPIEQDVVGLMLCGMIAPMNIYTFTASIKKLRRKYVLENMSSYRVEVAVPDGTYLEPFVWVIGWSIVILFATILVGLMGYVGT